ncbi:hypothetical protein Tco_0847446 [Tanacetum coccineum]
MVEEPVKMKKKDQISLDKELALKLQAEEEEEEERLAREKAQREEESNIVSWDNVQAMIDADYQMAQQMQPEEQEKLSIKEKSKLFVQESMKCLEASSGKEKSPFGKNLLRNFSVNFILNIHGEEEMLDEGDNWGIDPLEFISRVNSSFDKHMKMDGRTKKVLFHAWMNGSWNKRRMDDRILSSNDTTTDSFFRPYLKTSEKNKTEKDNELSQTKRKYSNTSNSIDEQPYKRICKAEKFEAIKYSLGPNEEYIAIRRCEYDAWERNEDRMSIIYQEIFQKKDNGWKVTRTE